MIYMNLKQIYIFKKFQLPPSTRVLDPDRVSLFFIYFHIFAFISKD